MRRSGETTTKQRFQYADPTENPGGGHGRTGNQPGPEGQTAPYGSSGKVAEDAS